MQRIAGMFAVLLLTSTTCFAQGGTLKGVEPSDINPKADPCTDFYEYANGTWRANNPIPASQVRWSRRFSAGEQTKDKLKDILDEVSRRNAWASGSVEQLIGDFYSGCMDEAKINHSGLAPLKTLLDDIDAMRNRKDVERIITHFHDLAIPVPFALFSNSDYHNPSQVIADVAASGIGLPDRDYYFKPEPRFEEARKKYRAHIANMFRLAGASEADAAAASGKVFAMETALAEASLDNVALRDPQQTDHKTSVADLRKMTPNFDWQGYFRATTLPEADLNIQEPKFMQAFDAMLGKSPVADWKTYLKWQLLRAAAPSLSEAFVAESFDFNQKFLQGAKEMKPRWKRCTEATDRWLGEALGKKYTDKYFPPAAKARMQEMVKNLLYAMGEVIRDLDWMGAATKKKALEKLSTFNPKIGYPDKWTDYSSVKVRRDRHWDNTAAARLFNVDDDRKQIGKPVDRGRWGMTPPTSNAYYNPLLNEIVFPAGILQPPAFNLEATDAVNYGAIGSVIGHEISHGFDDQGAQFDSTGRLENWWTDEDLKQFQARGACVVDQFEGYFIEPGIHHNGKLVLGEAIGDLAGNKIAYLAYQKSRTGKGPEPTINGFTPDQQFFIGWGQFRGDSLRPETQRLMVQSDPHPTGQYRVVGTVSNLTWFQEAFSCKKGAAMVRPEGKRCEVW